MYRALVSIHVNLMPICISHISNFSVKEKKPLTYFTAIILMYSVAYKMLLKFSSHELLNCISF